MSQSFPVPQPDLFGEMTAAPLPPAIGEKKRRKTVAKGYAAAPGSGPKGETCKTCAFSIHRGGGAKSYPKCLLARARWTGGPGSDIKMSAPACGMWKAPAGFGFQRIESDKGRRTKVAIITATADQLETKAGVFVLKDGKWCHKWGDLVVETIVLEDVKLTEGGA